MSQTTLMKISCIHILYIKVNINYPRAFQWIIFVSNLQHSPSFSPSISIAYYLVCVVFYFLFIEEMNKNSRKCLSDEPEKCRKEFQWLINVLSASLPCLLMSDSLESVSVELFSWWSKYHILRNNSRFRWKLKKNPRSITWFSQISMSLQISVLLLSKWLIAKYSCLTCSIQFISSCCCLTTSMTTRFLFPFYVYDFIKNIYLINGLG